VVVGQEVQVQKGESAAGSWHKIISAAKLCPFCKPGVSKFAVELLSEAKYFSLGAIPAAFSFCPFQAFPRPVSRENRVTFEVTKKLVHHP
jgi:hypothetical protein